MERIIEKQLSDAFEPRYKNYALAVIEDRALPDCKSGLKPSARKIIWDMYTHGMKASDPEKKCAKVVGSVLASTYPHGDASLYGALTRLGQDWTMRYPLVVAGGNFGSRDGDSAAAYRYTTTKLTRLGELTCRDIEKDTVEYKDNFDNTLKEPAYLPTIWPQLLANGTNGIAVGMSTYIPPHNLTELLNAADYMIECALKGEEYAGKDLFKFIKGPDFPDGGVITNNKDMVKILETGKGKIITKAKYEICEDKKGHYIKITQLPYQISKQKLVNKIDDMRIEGKIEGIREVSDETKRGDICDIIIKIKKGISPQLVEKQLLAKTDMQTSINYNTTVLVDDIPRQLSIKDCMDEFLLHALDVIRRRSTFDYNKISNKISMLEAIMKAVENIDRVIELVRTSDDYISDFIDEFEFTKEQAEHVADIKLSKLSKISIGKSLEELENLQEALPPLYDIINDDESALRALQSELSEIKVKYGDDRRTVIELEDEIDMEDLIKDEDLIITITSEGNIKSVATKEYNVQGRAGKGNAGAATKDDEIVTDLFTVNSKDDLLFITNKGRCHTIKAYKIPKTTRTSKGKNMVNYMSLEEGEYPIKTLATTLTDNDRCITMVTDKGQIKRLKLEHLSTKFSVTKVIKLIDGHEIADAILTSEEDDLMIATAHGMSVRFKASAVRPSGRTSQGVKGINLAEGDMVIGMTNIYKDCEIVTITEQGIAKATSESEFAAKSRGCKGIKCHKLSDKTGVIVSCFILNQEDMIVGTADSKIIRIATKNIARSGRATTGTKLIKLSKNDSVVAAACLPAEEVEIEEAE